MDRVSNNAEYSKNVLAWLASVGVFLRVTDVDFFRRLAPHDNGSLSYIIEHYPRYVFEH